jgi:hypothetical protein
MKLLSALSVAAVVGLSFAAQAQVREQDSRPGVPTAGPPQARDPATTTGQAPIAIPGAGSPYGARGGATGSPNPDRVPAGTSGGQSRPADEQK